MAGTDWIFKNWQLSEKNSEALFELKKIINHLQVVDKNKQQEIQDKLQGKFSNNYLLGYFETADSDQFGLWFIDWNKILGEMYGDYTLDNTVSFRAKRSEVEESLSPRDPSTLHLIGGSVGMTKVSGRVKIINNPTATIKPDEILVCKMTTPEYLPLMKICAGIITEQGGILSHAAIIARELKKPCVVGVKGVMSELKEGDVVEIDGEKISKLTISPSFLKRD